MPEIILISGKVLEVESLKVKDGHLRFWMDDRYDLVKLDKYRELVRKKAAEQGRELAPWEEFPSMDLFENKPIVLAPTSWVAYR